MKEIKFRAWDTRYNIYVFWDEISKTRILGILANNHNRGISNLVLEQFTGLYDKNGKEIYEGDTLKIYNDKALITEKELICSVETSLFGAWCAVVRRVNVWERYKVSPPEVGYILYFINLINTSFFEIIGNIHDL